MMRCALLISFILLGLSGSAQYLKNSVVDRFPKPALPKALAFYGLDQDSAGYIWVGSNHGLYRFDGAKLQQEHTTGVMKSRGITRVYCLSKQRTWLVGENPRREYLISPSGIEERQSIMRRLSEGRMGTLDRSNEVLYKYIMGNSTIVKDPLDGELEVFPYSGPELISMCFQDSLYILTEEPGYRVMDEGELHHRTIPNYPLEQILKFSKDSKGTLWAVGSTSIFRKPVHGTWSHWMTHDLVKELKGVYHVEFDGEGRMWMSGPASGLAVLEPENKRIERVDEELGLEDAHVSHLFRDREGNMWISTFNQGVLIVQSGSFRNYHTDLELLENQVHVLRPDCKNGLWVGMGTGLYHCSINEEGLPGTWTHPLSNILVTDIAQFGEGRLIVSSYGKQIDMIRKDSEDGHKEKQFIAVSALSVSRMSESTCILGGWRSLSTLVQDPNGPVGLRKMNICPASGRIHKVLEFQGRTLVLSTTGIFEIIDDDLEAVTGLSALGCSETDFMDMLVQGDSVLWISTLNGLLRFNGQRAEEWCDIYGLPFPSCRTLALDADGRLWIATNKGLRMIDGHQVYAYSMKDGLPDNEVQSLYYDSAFDILWIGTHKGLSCKLLSESKPHLTPLTAKCEWLEIPGDTGWVTARVPALSYDQNDVKLRFGIVNYSAPGETEFQYRWVSRSDSAWTSITTNEIEFNDLPSGKYTLEVRARRPSEWFGPASSMEFTINKAIWERWSFWLGVACLLGLLVFITLQWRKTRVERMSAQLEKMNSTLAKLEQQALEANMNPHFIFNALNSIQSLLQKHNDPEALEFIADFATLIRQNMEAVNEHSINLNNEIDRLDRYLSLEAFRMKARFKYEFEVDPEIDQNALRIPAMVVQPFVENAIWHGVAPSSRPGKISIAFQLPQANLLLITIQDNGIGIEHSLRQKESSHQSRGVQLIRDRIVMMSPLNKLDIEELHDSAGNASGTQVSIQIDLETMQV